MAMEDQGGGLEPHSSEHSTSRLSRRSLLLGGAATAAVGITVVVVAQGDEGSLPSAALEQERLPAGSESLDLPVGDFDAVDGITTFTTPIDEHYLIDTALERPRIDSETYVLSIGGAFARSPFTITYDELMSREHITHPLALVGVSNPVGGDLVGNAVWTGVSLTELLDEAGIDDPTNPERQIFSSSVDGYTAGFRAPLAYDGRMGMVALAMNGEPLPREHGFPARLIVNGLYGYTSSTKWLESIEINDWRTNDGFWIPRGWAKEAPVKTQSRIDTPGPGGRLTAGSNTVAGVAWAPGRGVSAVEVGFIPAASNLDLEDTEWFEAELATTESSETWVQWRYEWDAPVGDWVIQVRATDGEGVTQSGEHVGAAPNGAEGFHAAVSRVT